MSNPGNYGATASAASAPALSATPMRRIADYIAMTGALDSIGGGRGSQVVQV